MSGIIAERPAIKTFPRHFRFGTSTSAAQVETASGHDWVGFTARDGAIFNRTTDHELRWEEDLDIIRFLAPNYRMSLMWSRLQQGAFQDLDPDAVKHYRKVLQGLNDRGVEVMMVLHHFASPLWFTSAGGWAEPSSVEVWLDFVHRVVDTFGEFITSWNTFNEPNIYITMGSILGQFPPCRTNPVHAMKTLGNMARAHGRAVEFLHKQKPEDQVGVSINTAVLEGENLLGKLPARLSDWWYHEFIPSWFEGVDFFGMSYYARIGYSPMPRTVIETPQRFEGTGIEHDDMWEYYPKGLGINIRRFWEKYRIPVVITENGVCTGDDALRARGITEYLSEVHDCLQEGVDIRGYYHWSPWDNFEWNLGPSYRFGLYETDPKTHERVQRGSARLYARITQSRTLFQTPEPS